MIEIPKTALIVGLISLGALSSSFAMDKKHIEKKLDAKAADVSKAPQSETTENPHSPSEKGRGRIEELFKWKVSDALNLSPEEESKFSDTLKEVGDRRRQATEEMDRLIVKMKKPLKTEELEEVVRQYQEQTKVFTETQGLEFEKLKKLFGVKRFAEYVVLKSELNQKLKEYLSAGRKPKEGEDQKAKKKLSEPKIIEGE